MEARARPLSYGPLSLCPSSMITQSPGRTPLITSGHKRLRQEDFDKITEEKVASIIKEVGITVEEAEKIPGRYFDEKAKR